MGSLFKDNNIKYTVGCVDKLSEHDPERDHMHES
jgi:hypothetical protein